MRSEKIKQALGALACAAFLVQAATPADGANIVWVSDFNDPATGFFPAGSGHTDSGFVTLLRNAGHNVIRYNAPGAATTAIPAPELAALNTNDLIIIGRANGSGAYRLLQGNQWNTAVTKPLICMSPYLVRTITDNRMGWFTGDVGPDDTPTFATAADPSSPAVDFLLGGVAMLGNVTVDRFNEMLDRNTSHMLNAPVSGGRTLLTATFPREDNGTIATAQLITDFPAGTVVGLSNAPLAGYRMYMAGGSREGATFPNAIPLYTGRENLTPAGEDIFLRAVRLALNNGVPPSTDPSAPPAVVTQPSSISVLRGRAGSFSVAVSGAAPRTVQWQRDIGDGVTFTNIPDASTPFLNSRLSLASVADEDNNAKFRVEVSNANGTVVSDVVTLTVTPDTAPPVPLAAGSLDGVNVVITFDELLDNDLSDGDSAGDAFAYTITDSEGEQQPQSATVLPDGRSVALVLLAPIRDVFTATITGVEDRYKNAIPASGVNVPGVNLGLSTANVGALNPGGTEVPLGTTGFLVSGGGLDVQAGVEQMRFAYKSVEGDFDARIRVLSITGTNRLESVAKAILGARAATDGNAASVNAFVTPPAPGDGTFGSTARTSTGALTSSNFVSVPYAPGSTPATFPAWLRIKRVGDQFTTYGSSNGNDWTQLGSISVAMGSPVLVGAGASSHRNGQIATAAFSNFQILPVINSPTLVSSAYVAGTFSAAFQTQNGVAYRVQFKSDLNAANWSDLTTINGDGTVKSFTDTAGGNRFYRVITP